MCSSIINEHLNQEIRIRFLTFIINRERFPSLECLCFIECKHISSSWSNVQKWIDYIIYHSSEHQLKYLQFDSLEKEQQLMDQQARDDRFIWTNPSCFVHIQRFVSKDTISLWIERECKSLSFFCLY